MPDGRSRQVISRPLLLKRRNAPDRTHQKCELRIDPPRLSSPLLLRIGGRCRTDQVARPRLTWQNVGICSRALTIGVSGSSARSRACGRQDGALVERGDRWDSGLPGCGRARHHLSRRHTSPLLAGLLGNKGLLAAVRPTIIVLVLKHVVPPGGVVRDHLSLPKPVDNLHGSIQFMRIPVDDIGAEGTPTLFGSATRSVSE
jgi:hypothetical protein